MFKRAMAALFATAALLPAVARAQDTDRMAGGMRERAREIKFNREGGEEQGRRERPQFQRPAQVQQQQQQQQAAPAFQPQRQPDQPRPSYQPRAEAQVQAQAQGGWQGRGDRREGFGGRPRFGQQPVQPQQVQPQQVQPRGDWRRSGGQDFKRSQPQGDWRRPDVNRTAPLATDQRRSDDRRAGQQRRFDDDGRSDDQRRRFEGQRRFDSGRFNQPGYAWNGRNDWSRGWREDNRYDWNRYRQQNRSAFRLPRYYAPYDWSYGYRRFSIGVTLSSLLWSQDYWIDDPWDYRLPPAYGPYRWVRYYNDALLVDIRTGYVVDTVYDIFW